MSNLMSILSVLALSGAAKHFTRHSISTPLSYPEARLTQSLIGCRYHGERRYRRNRPPLLHFLIVGCGPSFEGVLLTDQWPDGRCKAHESQGRAPTSRPLVYIG
jgi:hypothetical protein